MALLVFGDLVIFYATLFAGLYLRYQGSPEPGLIESHRVPFTIIFILWVTVFGAFGLYDLRFVKNSKHFLYRILRAMLANFVLAVLVLYLIPYFEIEPRRNLFIIAFFSTLLVFTWRYLFNLLISRTKADRVLFFGINRDVVELANILLKNPQLGFRPIAFMTLNQETPNLNTSIPILAPRTELRPLIQDLSLDTIVISSEIKENKTLVNVLFQAIPLGTAIVEFPAFYEANTGKIPLSLIGEVWFLENLVGGKKQLYEFFKRILDLAIASILIVPAALMLPFLVLAIKIDSVGPVFFRQKRAGRNGKEFALIKFRSMVDNAATLGGNKGYGSDPRHTRAGVFLRKNYLDELPQILNVLKGEMSFIGPRPERPEYIKDLKAKTPFYEMRLLVPPGLTGWAQIHMENDASVEDAPEKMQYDLYYIKNRSLVLDLLIALKTMVTILRRQGR